MTRTKGIICLLQLCAEGYPDFDERFTLHSNTYHVLSIPIETQRK